jgi:hypothetical protein
MIKKAKFVGCIDDKPLFRINSKRFFLTKEEAQKNEDFNEIGGCGI